MRYTTEYSFALLLLIVVIVAAVGIALGHDIGQTTAQISVLNGTAEMRLKKQSDNTVDWIKVEPYAVRCLPVENNGE